MIKFGKYFSNIGRKLFVAHTKRKIHKIFAHLEGRKKYDFPFSIRAQMKQQTRSKDLRAMLDLIERHAPEMGEAYGDAFCYLLHCDIHDRLEVYLRELQQRIPHASRIAAFDA